MSKEYLIATEDRLIVKRITETITDGGIAIPESHQKKQRQTRGTVIAVGPLATEFCVNDVVLFVRSGVEFEFNNEEFIALRRSEVIAKIK